MTFSPLECQQLLGVSTSCWSHRYIAFGQQEYASQRILTTSWCWGVTRANVVAGESQLVFPLFGSPVRLLGWNIDTAAFSLALPEVKHKRFCHKCQHLLNWDLQGVLMVVQTVSHLLGQLMATVDTV